MDSAAVKDKVIEIICSKLDVAKEKVTMETRFSEDLGADSLDSAELIMEFEDEFEVSIPDNQQNNIKNVGDVVKMITDEVAKKQG